MKKRYAIRETCVRVGLPEDELLEFIRRDWIEPAEHGPLPLDDEDVARIRLILELREDLGVNDEAIPIILRLLDQLYGMRQLLTRVADQKRAG
jgi:chaperone modulatory protein CbpM